MYKLYYASRNASWAPHLVLNDLGVNYELVLVDRKSNQQKSEEYLKLNPTGRIPTLVHDELVIFESAAICLYLCEQHPHSELVPKKSPLSFDNLGPYLQNLAEHQVVKDVCKAEGISLKAYTVST